MTSIYSNRAISQKLSVLPNTDGQVLKLWQSILYDSGPVRPLWLDGTLSQLYQWRYLKQAQIRASSGGPHTWGSNRAIPQFHWMKALGKIGLPQSFFCHFREVRLCTSKVPTGNEEKDIHFFLNAGMVALWLDSLLHCFPTEKAQHFLPTPFQMLSCTVYCVHPFLHQFLLAFVGFL